MEKKHDYATLGFVLFLVAAAVAIGVIFWTWIVMIFAPLFMEGTLSFTESIPYGFLATIIASTLQQRQH